MIATQNPELDIDRNLAESMIRPVFKRGPREGPHVWWVVEVRPDLYYKMKAGRLFIGMMRCRTSEFEEITQCFACYKFGHIAANCRMDKPLCDYCAKEGHTDKVCKVKAEGGRPSCINCKKAYVISQGLSCERKDTKKQRSQY